MRDDWWKATLGFLDVTNLLFEIIDVTLSVSQHLCRHEDDKQCCPQPLWHGINPPQQCEEKESQAHKAPDEIECLQHLQELHSSLQEALLLDGRILLGIVKHVFGDGKVGQSSK